MAYATQSRTTSTYYPTSEDQEFFRHSNQISYLDQQTLQIEHLRQLDDQANDNFYNVRIDFTNTNICYQKFGANVRSNYLGPPAAWSCSQIFFANFKILWSISSDSVWFTQTLPVKGKKYKLTIISRFIFIWKRNAKNVKQRNFSILYLILGKLASELPVGLNFK